MLYIGDFWIPSIVVYQKKGISKIYSKALLCHIINVSQEIMHPTINQKTWVILSTHTRKHKSINNNRVDKLNRQCPPKTLVIRQRR